jgi:hypothetical protein
MRDDLLVYFSNETKKYYIYPQDLFLCSVCHKEIEGVCIIKQFETSKENSIRFRCLNCQDKTEKDIIPGVIGTTYAVVVDCVPPNARPIFLDRIQFTHPRIDTIELAYTQRDEETTKISRKSKAGLPGYTFDDSLKIGNDEVMKLIEEKDKPLLTQKDVDKELDLLFSAKPISKKIEHKEKKQIENKEENK